MPVFKGGGFKAVLRYCVYLFVGGWMFFLGILVGRGTAPVTFDTTGFHSRLEAIVQSYGTPDAPEEKIDLEFYDVLDKPVRQEVRGKEISSDEIIPKKETKGLVTRMPIIEAIPVKTSRKAATLNKAALVKKEIPAKKEIQVKKEKQAPAVQDSYTLQVAAFKSASDAAVQMAALKKKGFTAYQTLGKKGDVTWYRVRVGSFATRKEAGLYADKLKHAKIEAMIINKE
jgi:septal ring-binding cell division protein DamX